MAGMDTLAITPGDLTDPRVLKLLADHLDDMYTVSPPESVHALDVSGLMQPNVSFWVIGDDETTVGCVALKELDREHGELKSMRTDANVRGQGLGRRLLMHALQEARSRGYRRMSLETGSQDFFEPARRLYETYGFEICGPFADYELDPLSVFMTRELPS
jgi:putative acetyltransferase